MNVTARAELTNIDGNKLIFRIEAFDESEKIGEGTHQRFIIELGRFREKAKKKSVRN